MSGTVPARALFLDAMSLVASSVSVLTTDGPAGRDGMAISAMTPVSADGPFPILLVCVNAASRPAPRLIGNGVFCVNVLTERQLHLADRFAGRSGMPVADWFEQDAWQSLATGAPALAGALASFDCRIAGTSRHGTHEVIFGHVEAIALGGGDAGPLVHARRSYQRLSQPT